MSRIGKKWLFEEDEKLVEEIALEHSRNIGGIKSRVISHIIYPKYKNENMSIDDLSIEYNLDKEIINRQINKLDDKDILIRIEKKLDKIISYLIKE